MARLAMCVLGMSVVVLLLWITAFVIACMLVAWANTPPVIDACGGFWEFMLASVLSPVIIPVAYFTLALGVVSWFSAAFPKATPHSHTAAPSLVPLLRTLQPAPVYSQWT